MKLTFASQHKSILSFPLTEIETGFVIITGINGAGKTHLLEAILNGSVVTEGISHGAGNIRLFHHSNMQPNDTGIANPSQLWSQRTELWNELRGQLLDQEQAIRSDLISNGIPSNKIENIAVILTWTENDINGIVNDQSQASQIHQLINSRLDQADNQVFAQWRQTISAPDWCRPC